MKGSCLVLFYTCLFFIAVNGQQRARTCRLFTGRLGLCVHISSCPEAWEDIRRGLRPEICDWQGINPVVCCPASANLKAPGAKSDEYCAKFHKAKPPQNFNGFANNVFPAVVGGSPSLSREFPHMAALGYGDKDSIQWLCGGSLISDRYVLTAAHCLKSQEFGEVTFVRLGDLNIKDTNDDAEPQDFSVVEIIRHPDYKTPSQYNDIGLLKLEKPIDVTAYVKPACLPTNPDLFYTKPIATGWGRTSFGGDSSDVLQKVNLEYFDNENCKAAYESIPQRKLSRGIDDETQICAGSVNEEKDTCQGDSGGPLQIKNEKYYAAFDIVGITSFGKACGIANSPGVYTRVSHYVPWIEEIVFKDV